MAKDNDTPIESRTSKMLNRKVPDLAIKLSRLFEFNVSGDTAQFLDQPWTAENSFLADHLVQQSALVNTLTLTKRHSIDLPPGVTIIIGKSGSGKTKLALAHMTAMNENVVYARYGEPLDKRFVELLATKAAEQGVTLLKFEVDVANTIANFLFQPGTDVLIIDSLRYLFYAGGGSTGKGGVNMTLFADISFLDLVASQANKSLVIIVNPLTDDDASYKAIVEAAKGSVSAIVDVQSPTSVRYSSRYEERDWKSINLPESSTLDNSPQRLDAPSARSASLRNAI